MNFENVIVRAHLLLFFLIYRLYLTLKMNRIRVQLITFALTSFFLLLSPF